MLPEAQMRLTQVVLTALTPLAIGACGPSVHFTELNGRMRPREGLATVAVLNTHIPACPYTELGIATAFPGLSPQKGALDALKRKALEVGGDAIVAIQTVNSGGRHPTQGYSATVIRFDQPGCRQ